MSSNAHVRLRSTLGAILTSLLLAAPATGQERPIQIDFLGGFAQPVGDLADAADLGPSFTIGVNYLVTPRFGIRFDGGADLLDGTDALDPSLGQNSLEIDLVRLHGGGIFSLLPPESPWRLDVNGGAGATVFSVPEIEGGLGNRAVNVDISEVYFSAAGGLDIGYRISERLSVFVDGRITVTLADEEDTDEISDLLATVGETVEPLETIYTVPVTGGVRLSF